MSVADRPTALVVVSTSCQLFSGTGVALFDWMRLARHAIAFSLLIDTEEPESFGVASQAASVFLLLSDFEAFGLPIAEALCCGTPVVINRQRETATVFADLPGVTLVRNSDPDAIRDGLLDAIAEPADRQRIAQAACRRFGMMRTCGRKLDLVMGLLGRPGLGLAAPQVPAMADRNALAGNPRENARAAQ